MTILGVLITALAVAGLLADGGDPAPPTPATTTTVEPTPTTGRRGFPPAGEQSVCQLVSTEEAELLVGHALEEAVIEPTDGQCAWPTEEGTPLDADLFFVIKEREQDDLMVQLAEDWDPTQFRIEAVSGLGEQAAFVIARAGAGDEFVEGLDVYTGDLHVLFGNGGRPVWEGAPSEVRGRLRTVMETVLARIDERLGVAPRRYASPS